MTGRDFGDYPIAVPGFGGTKTMMKFLFCLCLSSLLFLANINPNRANSGTASQPTPAPDDKPIYTGELIVPNQTTWSPDGTALYFTGLDLTEHFYRYSLASRQLTELAARPFTKILTSTEQSKFDAADAAVSLSPDGRTIVYASNSAHVCGGEAGCYPRLALGEVDSGKHILVSGPVLRLPAIHWSADSSAFVIADLGNAGLGGVFYVSVPRLFQEDIRSILLMNYTTGSEGFVDISADGRRVLLREQREGWNTGLYLWDVAVADTRQQFSALGSPLILKDTPIAGAVFSENGKYLLIVTDVGIIQYDLETHTTARMFSGIDTRWVDWALFSPGAKNVAILTHPILWTNVKEVA